MTAEHKLIAGVVLVLLGKIIWDWVVRLKEPTNDEVREITRIEGRINSLEREHLQLAALISEKVDNAVWLERSAKLEGFSKQHNTELQSVRNELTEVHKLLRGGEACQYQPNCDRLHKPVI